MTQFPTIEFLSEAQLLVMYGWWQLAVCLFAFIALIAIWWHIGRRQNDFGQVWLALSVLCWSFSGGVEVYFGKQFQSDRQEVYQKLDSLLSPSGATIPLNQEVESLKEDFERNSQEQEKSSFLLDGSRSILSLFNSLFILLALPWFRYIPKRIEPIVKSRYWHYIVGLPFLFSLLPTISKMASGRSLGLISELDVYYAALTLIFLGGVLWDSFAKRRLKILAWLSLLCILITFVAQLYKLTDWNINLTLFSAIFKTSLIMIFFALALSWVKELSENIIPEAHQLFMAFERLKLNTGRYEQVVKLKGFPGIQERRIALTPGLFDLLLKFARRKTQQEGGWLEIKPKGEIRAQKEYDIKDYNEVKRLLIALLDGIFGKDNWAKNQHMEPLKNSLFELSKKRERKIRLALPKENVRLL